MVTEGFVFPSEQAVFLRLNFETLVGRSTSFFEAHASWVHGGRAALELLSLAESKR